MIPNLQKFGDASWTQDKLERVRKYLAAYTKIMRKTHFEFAYIDGFAGTGYHELRRDEAGESQLFPEIEEPEVQEFLDGSARIALQVEPRFKKYIFIEKDPRKAIELEKLKAEFPEKSQDIVIKISDANIYLQDMCRGKTWTKHRAVLFIDPFGMQLTWETLVAIANTKAIDTWILFPVSAVNRLLRKDGNIPESWKNRLELMFGEPGWFDVFFPMQKGGLFDDDLEIRRKFDDISVIGSYFEARLATAFAGVAKNPLLLRNSKGAPLFLLCFAAANEKGAPTALRIAEDILKRDPPQPPLLPLE